MIHRLQLRAIIHSTENPEKVTTALRAVLPPDTEVAEEEVEGYHGNVMRLLTAAIDNKRAATDALKGILARLEPAERERVRAELPGRVDEECTLHLRLDKQRAYAGEVRLAQGEDCIYLRAKAECYPARRDAAVSVIRGLLSGA